MTPSIIAFVTVTLTFAVSVGLYLANVRLVARRSQSTSARWAILPFLAPVLAWRLGARTLPVAFAVSAALYGVLSVATR